MRGYIRPNFFPLTGLIIIVFAAVMLVYTQYYRYIEPCIMCIYQRYALLGTFVALLLALRLRYAGYILALLASGYGLYTAIMQSLLPTGHSQVCAEVAPPTTFVWGGSVNTFTQKIFTGYGSCAVAGHKLLMDIPLIYWSIALFCGMVVLVLLGLWQKIRNRLWSNQHHRIIRYKIIDARSEHK